MIRAVGFLDTLALSAAVYRNKSLFDGPDGPINSLPLSGLLKAKEWAPAKTVVARALTLLTTVQDGRPALAAVALERLAPGTWQDWAKTLPEEVSTIMRFVVPVTTNPACHVYSGPFTAHIPVGQLSFIDVGQACSETNFGDSVRYHLVIDIKVPEKVEIKE